MEITRSFIAVMLGVAIFLLTTSLMPQQSASAADKRASRAFYLTTTTHTGAQATSACAANFHMASLWEIFDPSNLRYDPTLGATADDSGAGPPFLGGWVRTGTPALDAGAPGEVNCNAWTSSLTLDSGTTAALHFNWVIIPGPIVSPWLATQSGCHMQHPVWCVED